jgi:hypothetical protein
LVLLEASKVRGYHSTLMDGILHAWSERGLAARWSKPLLCCHESFYAHLSAEARTVVDFRPVPVLDQDKRQWIRKSLVEAWVVLRCLMRLRRGDVLLITTIMPSAMILVEFLRFLFPGRRLVVMQHGEIEGAFDKDRQRIGSFGFYILLWMRMRRLGMRTHLAVLDRFIAEAVLRHFPQSVAPDELHVIPLPMIAAPTPAIRAAGSPRACFVGFNTRNKGFDVFERLADQLPAIEFRVIGAGVDRDLRGGNAIPVGSSDEFLAALGRCDIAIFPYTGGYSCSISAAATDAISSGLHLMATPRGCFVALADAFGPEIVTICQDWEEIAARLGDAAWVADRIEDRGDRAAAVAASRYGLASVGQALDDMMTKVTSIVRRRRLNGELA